jgi:hypothetical protein
MSYTYVGLYKTPRLELDFEFIANFYSGTVQPAGSIQHNKV